MYRRIMFIGLLPLMGQKSSRKATFGLLMALCSLIVFREVEPYRKSSTNMLASSAQVMLVLTFSFALTLETNFIGSHSNGFAFGVMLVIINMSAFVVFAYLLVLRARREEAERRKNQIRPAKIEWACNFTANKFR